MQMAVESREFIQAINVKCVSQDNAVQSNLSGPSIHTKMLGDNQHPTGPGAMQNCPQDLTSSSLKHAMTWGKSPKDPGR